MDTPNELINIKLPPTFCAIPFGLHLIGDIPKKLLLITWNHNTVVTYKFRHISVEFLTKSLENFNLLEPNDVHEIKHFLEPNEMIANVFDTLVNTFLLTNFGRLFVFDSTKMVRKLILSTSNKVVVKSLGYTASGIYLIENRNANEMFIKFYTNEMIQSENCEGATEPVEYNLNIEDNLKFNISRLDETSCIQIFKFDENLRNILEGLIGSRIDDSITYIDVVLFSIESNLFWLNTYSEDNLIQPLNVSSSKIANFTYSKAQNFIICLLEAGVIEILYFLPNFNMISKYYHTLGVQLNCYKFIGSNNLIYSTDHSLIQLSFFNDKNDSDGIDIETKTINVCGSQGIAYNELLKQIFVITNNFQLFNINYNTNYFQLTQNTNSNTNFNLHETKNFSKILFDKSETIKNLESLKNTEINKIRLLDLIKLLESDKTRIHDSNTCRINLVYRQNQLLQFVCTFKVHLKIIEHAEQFKIVIELRKFDRNVIHTFDVENKIMFKKTIAYEFDPHRNSILILPKFKIYLVTRISMAADSIAYEFPMQILNNYYDDINQNYFYLNYNRREEDVRETKPTMHLGSIYNFRIQNVDMNLEKLLKCLNFEYEDGYCEYLFLNYYKFRIKFVEGLVTIETECPQSLYCIKHYILKQLNPSVEFKEGIMDSLQKLKYALPEEDQITSESQPKLEAILQNLRNEFVPTFKIPEKKT